jgi:hypothetical protein
MIQEIFISHNIEHTLFFFHNVDAEAQVPLRLRKGDVKH